MRLTEKQKNAVLTARPGSSLTRVGDSWAVVWKNQTGRTWHGQLVHDVVEEFDTDELCVRHKVWWLGSEQIAKQRKLVLQGLTEENS